jgi:predicted metal-binding transcription factor (methanogenesis marker protein 9)
MYYAWGTKEMTNGEIVSIDDILQVLEKHKINSEKEIKDIQKKINLLKNFKEGKNLLKSDILSLVCYNDLSYCCGLKKTCIWRDSALNMFGITAKEYVDAKDKCQAQLLDDKIVRIAGKKHEI